MNTDDERRDDLTPLLEGLEVPVVPAESFRAALEQELAARVAPRRGEGPLPEGWALCPFDRLCIAEQKLPLVARMNCPCLHAGPLLKFFAGRNTPVHARPCTGKKLREARHKAPRDS